MNKTGSTNTKCGWATCLAKLHWVVLGFGEVLTTRVVVVVVVVEDVVVGIVDVVVVVEGGT